MPVTAKLSRKFYERFGDEIATEFVDWFNAVDATYQNQLREVNELNWERFKAELRAVEAGLRKEMAEMKGDLLKWMFVYWTGTILTIGGLLVALKLH